MSPMSRHSVTSLVFYDLPTSQPVTFFCSVTFCDGSDGRVSGCPNSTWPFSLICMRDDGSEGQSCRYLENLGWQSSSVYPLQVSVPCLIVRGRILKCLSNLAS